MEAGTSTSEGAGAPVNPEQEKDEDNKEDELDDKKDEGDEEDEHDKKDEREEVDEHDDEKDEGEKEDEHDDKKDEDEEKDDQEGEDNGFEHDEHPDEEEDEINEGHRWNVIGPCKKDETGTCVMSPSFPDSYNNNQNCRMTMKGPPDPISSVSFATEQGTDILTVNGVAYSGTKGPSSIVPTGTIFWSSDNDTPDMGWKLCIKNEDNWYAKTPPLSATAQNPPQVAANAGSGNVHGGKSIDEKKGSFPWVAMLGVLLPVMSAAGFFWYRLRPSNKKDSYGLSGRGSPMSYGRKYIHLDNL